MRIAIISDIHSNLEAFLSVLNKIDSMKINQIFCLGDIVGYGADPKEVLRIISRKKIPCIMGNHDYAVSSGDVLRFNLFASDSIYKNIEMISESEIKFLGSLEKHREVDVEGKKIFLVHASPRDPLWEYVYEGDDLKTHLDLCQSDILFMGHTHIPFVREINGRIVINSGSVGQPRDGDPRASFSVYDSEKDNAEIVRVHYDIDAAAEKIISANIPIFLAQRLFSGT